jgi:hypothetical protein
MLQKLQDIMQIIKNLKLVNFAAKILKFFAIRGQKNYVTLKALTCDRAMIIAAIKGDRK